MKITSLDKIDKTKVTMEGTQRMSGSKFPYQGMMAHPGKEGGRYVAEGAQGLLIRSKLLIGGIQLFLYDFR